MRSDVLSKSHLILSVLAKTNYRGLTFVGQIIIQGYS